MFKKYLIYLKQFDWILFFITLILICLGLAAIYSVSAVQDPPNFLNFKKQIIFGAAGVFFLFLMSFLNYHYLKIYSLFIYIGGIILLIAVLFFGVSIRGTHGWFSVFGQIYQPVELAKIILLIILCKFFSDWHGKLDSLSKVLISIMIAGLMILLVVLQPDFGSALIFLGLYLGLLIFLKVRRIYFILLILALILVVTVTWLFFLKDYQKERVLTFINPSRDPLGSGYNVTQSIIAVGSGQIFGRGLGLGPQSRLHFLPLQQTDFIFAVIAEELGLFGILLLISLLATFFYRIVRIARRARDDFGLLLASSIGVLFFIQIFINIGMNLGILPVTGIPLPLVSYGGSSLLASLIAIGILESIYIRRRRISL